MVAEEKPKAEEKSKAEELKERAGQIAAQTAQKTEEAVKEFKEEAVRSEKAKKAASKETIASGDVYLASGAYIGTQRKTKDMKKFIFKVRSDGLAVLDVATIDRRIHTAATFLARFAPEKVMVICSRDIGKKPVKKFCELTGCRDVITRFMPGSLTNPSFKNYIEPELVFVVDPGADKQAILEALRVNVPIVSICNTNNMTQNIDLIIPANNRGKKALALVFWVLSRELLKAKGKINSADEFTYKVEDFEEKDLKEVRAGER